MQENKKANVDVVWESEEYYSNLIQKGPVVGSRFETCRTLVAYWKHKGLTDREIWNNLVTWSKGKVPGPQLVSVFQACVGEYQ